jgi:integrase
MNRVAAPRKRIHGRSLTQIEPGWWECRWTVTEDGKRKYKRRRFEASGQREAEKKRTKVQAELDSGTHPRSSNLTVAQVMDRWLRDVVEGTVRAGTMNFHLINTRQHIAPRLGSTRLDRLTAPEIDRFERQLLASGLTGTTVRNVHSTLRGCLNQAEKWGLIAVNPIRRVTQPRRNDPNNQFLTETQLVRLLNALKGHRLYLPALIAAHTGMRRGEVLGLTWFHFDAGNSQLSVHQSLEIAGHEVRIKPPKSRKSKRTLKIGSDLVRVLLEEKDRQAAERNLLGKQWNPEGWIVCREDGNAWHPNGFSSVWCQWIRRQDEIPAIRFHDLRHTHASHLIWAGVPIKLISQRLGHEKIQTTLDTYGHLLEAHDEEAVRRLEERYQSIVA